MLGKKAKKKSFNMEDATQVIDNDLDDISDMIKPRQGTKLNGRNIAEPTLVLNKDSGVIKDKDVDATLVLD